MIHKIHLDPNSNIEQYAYRINSSSNEAKAIRYVLNFYEYLAVGIKMRVYNEDILKESMYTTIVMMNDKCHNFIEYVRRDGQKTAFMHFECLARSWKNKPLKIKES